ncbi:hypothetical protein KIL84_019604 [Mauremys mutica]|uniref:Uncharacterized protein n=1 Tax=Mauremys mutica TaxID=74926 RepID=A0A9D4BAT2_9SAUR|nr:hypothetical protein KIL84_019604 [Mauremys mutica]
MMVFWVVMSQGSLLSSSSWRYKREICCETPEMAAPIQASVARATYWPVAAVGPMPLIPPLQQCPERGISGTSSRVGSQKVEEKHLCSTPWSRYKPVMVKKSKTLQMTVPWSKGSDSILVLGTTLVQMMSPEGISTVLRDYT